MSLFNNSVPDTFADLLQQRLKELESTQSAFAREVGVSTQAVLGWVHGKNIPSVGLLWDIMEAAQVDALELIWSLRFRPEEKAALSERGYGRRDKGNGKETKAPPDGEEESEDEGLEDEEAETDGDGEGA